MNIIFGSILLISSAILCFVRPESLLPTLIEGGETALDLSIKLIVVYAVWLGIFELLKESGLSNIVAKKLKPINKLLFGKLPDKANDYISMNIASNVLGISGGTTPMGINAIKELDKEKNTDFAVKMFFVINATSIQLIPTSILALRIKSGSVSSYDIILPTIITTLISTVVGILLTKVFVKK